MREDPKSRGASRILEVLASARDSAWVEDLPHPFGSPTSRSWCRSGYAVLLACCLPLLTGFSLFPARRSSTDAIPALHPPRAEIPPAFWEQYGWYVAAGGVVLVVLVGGGVWLLSRPKPAVAVAPEVEARQALEPLRHQPETGAVLSRVSRILRRYLLQAFDLPPGEPTTAELSGVLGSTPETGPDLRVALGDFLSECDQRKFGPGAVLPALEAVDRALKLIDMVETRRALLHEAAATPPPKLGSNPPPS
jgi:hypothetical protein